MAIKKIEWVLLQFGIKKIIKTPYQPHLSVLDGLKQLHHIVETPLIDILVEKLEKNEIKIGTFGQAINLDYILEPNDRIEIYKHLLIDPKKARLIRISNKNKKK